VGSKSVGLALSFILLVPALTSADNAAETCKAGDRALSAGQFDLARGQYESCMKKAPPNFEALSNLGIVYAQLGQFAEAVKVYRQALALSPENPKLRTNLGLAYLKIAHYAEAEREFARALLTEPDNLQVEELLAFCQYHLEQYELSALTLERVRKARPGEASAAFLLGSAYLKLNLYNQAIPLIDFALRTTNTAETHAILGQAYLGVKAYHEALKELLAAQAVDPNIPGLHDALGTAYSGLGNADLALAEYQKELARDPNDFEANYYLGRLKRLAGDLEASKKYLSKAEQLRPQDPAVQYEFAVFAIQNKDFARAQGLLEGVLSKYPNYTDAHVLLAEVYFRTQRKEEGQREKAIVDALKKADQERQSSQGPPAGDNALPERAHKP